MKVASLVAVLLPFLATVATITGTAQTAVARNFRHGNIVEPASRRTLMAESSVPSVAPSWWESSLPLPSYHPTQSQSPYPSGIITATKIDPSIILPPTAKPNNSSPYDMSSHTPTDAMEPPFTGQPSAYPSTFPSVSPSRTTNSPSPSSTIRTQSLAPSSDNNQSPSQEPTLVPTLGPTIQPSKNPTQVPTQEPSPGSTMQPSTSTPSIAPSMIASNNPSSAPSDEPTLKPSFLLQTTNPSNSNPTQGPSFSVGNLDPEPSSSSNIFKARIKTVSPAPSWAPRVNPYFSSILEPTSIPSNTSKTLKPTALTGESFSILPSVTTILEDHVPMNSPTSLQMTSETWSETTTMDPDSTTLWPTFDPTQEPTFSSTEVYISNVPADSLPLAGDASTLSPTFEPTEDSTFTFTQLPVTSGPDESISGVTGADHDKSLLQQCQEFMQNTYQIENMSDGIDFIHKYCSDMFPSNDSERPLNDSLQIDTQNPTFFNSEFPTQTPSTNPTYMDLSDKPTIHNSVAPTTVPSLEPTKTAPSLAPTSKSSFVSTYVMTDSTTVYGMNENERLEFSSSPSISSTELSTMQPTNELRNSDSLRLVRVYNTWNMSNRAGMTASAFKSSNHFDTLVNGYANFVKNVITDLSEQKQMESQSSKLRLEVSFDKERVNIYKLVNSDCPESTSVDDQCIIVFGQADISTDLGSRFMYTTYVNASQQAIVRGDLQREFELIDPDTVLSVTQTVPTKKEATVNFTTKPFESQNESMGISWILIWVLVVLAIILFSLLLLSASCAKHHRRKRTKRSLHDSDHEASREDTKDTYGSNDIQNKKIISQEASIGCSSSSGLHSGYSESISLIEEEFLPVCNIHPEYESNVKDEAIDLERQDSELHKSMNFFPETFCAETEKNAKTHRAEGMDSDFMERLGLGTIFAQLRIFPPLEEAPQTVDKVEDVNTCGNKISHEDLMERLSLGATCSRAEASSLIGELSLKDEKDVNSISSSTRAVKGKASKSAEDSVKSKEMGEYWNRMMIPIIAELTEKFAASNAGLKSTDSSNHQSQNPGQSLRWSHNAMLEFSYSASECEDAHFCEDSPESVSAKPTETIPSRRYSKNLHENIQLFDKMAALAAENKPQTTRNGTRNGVKTWRQRGSQWIQTMMSMRSSNACSYETEYESDDSDEESVHVKWVLENGEWVRYVLEKVPS